MMIVSTTTYADFKTLVSLLRKIDFVCYNQSALIPWSGSAQTYTVAYAFDMERNQCISLQSNPTSQFVPTDFPSAVQISGHLLIGDMNSVSGTANPF